MKQFSICLLIGFCLVSAWCSAQTFQVDTLRKSGPIANRINVVILGDGFTQSELPAFTQAAQKFVTFFLSYSPYNAYQNYFNFYSIPIPSKQSGATNPGTAPDRYPNQPVETKDTYFGSSFGTSNIHRLVAIRNYSAFTNVMATNFPSYDLAVMIVNSPWYGGSGGNPATFTLDPQADLIAMHEVGHIFSALTDEYWAGLVYAHEAANMTRITDPNSVVWKNWLNQQNIGIFPHTGAADAGNWYKPTTHNCLMEQLDKLFCAVCREATTARILNVVKSVESIQPQTGSPVVVNEQPTLFRLGLLKPEPNTLRVEWRLNNQLIGQNSDQLTLTSSQLTDPTATLSVSVVDTTPFIRLASHRTNHRYTTQWSLVKGTTAPPFSLTATKRSVCAGESITLTALNCAGAVTWSTSATGTSVTVSPAQSTTYSATCTGSASQTATIDVQVFPLPTASAANTGPYLEGQPLQLTAQGGKRYRWTGPDNFQSTEQNPTIQSVKISQAGSYTVVVTNEQGCSSTAQTQVTVNPVLAVHKLPTDMVRIFPNPSKGRVQIQTSLDGLLEVTLLDETGHVVAKKSFFRDTELSTDKLPRAVYIYRISTTKGLITGKLLVE
ncbi:hypothetical protein GCM10027341_44630 [Spirosoma knui]